VLRSGAERPLWLRWLFAVCAFSLLTAVIVLVVHGLNHSGGATTDKQAARRANREGQVLIAQDQSPRGARLERGRAPAPALARAIAGDVRRQVAAHQLAGPAGSVRCQVRGRSRAARAPYRCVTLAGAVSYLFFAVVDRRARRLVWCRQDQVQGSGLAVPLDPTCLS
jgi:hypothetical protein